MDYDITNRAAMILARTISKLIQMSRKVDKVSYDKDEPYRLVVNNEVTELLLHILNEWAASVDEDLLAYFPTQAEIDALNAATKAINEKAAADPAEAVEDPDQQESKKAAEPAEPAAPAANEEPAEPEAPAPRRKRLDIDMPKVHALRNAGWTIEKVAEEFGVSSVTIIKRLKEEQEAKA